MDQCFYCGVTVYKEMERRNKHNYPLQTLDHVIPQWMTKVSETKSRTVVSCQDCNLAKGNLTIDEYRILLAFRYGYVSNIEFKFAGE